MLPGLISSWSLSDLALGELLGDVAILLMSNGFAIIQSARTSFFVIQANGIGPAADNRERNCFGTFSYFGY